MHKALINNLIYLFPNNVHYFLIYPNYPIKSRGILTMTSIYRGPTFLIVNKRYSAKPTDRMKKKKKTIL
jgi:hypothetical protein